MRIAPHLSLFCPLKLKLRHCPALTLSATRGNPWRGRGLRFPLRQQSGNGKQCKVSQGRCRVTCGGGGFLSDRSNSGPCPKDLPAALWQAECTGPSGRRWSLLTGRGGRRSPGPRFESGSAYAKPHPGKISFASAGSNDASRAYARSRPFERTSWNRLAKDGVLVG